MLQTTDPQPMTSASQAGPAATPIIRLTDTHVSFGSNKVLKGIDLSVNKSEVCALIGPSGSGKTTLLRCVNALTQIERGLVEVNGHVISDRRDGRINDPSAADLCRYRAEIGFVFQHFNLFPHLTAAQNIALALRRVRRMSRHAARERAIELLTWVSLLDKADTLPGYLSGGQKQRVAIARALAMRPQVMLFDEATSALDPERVGEVLEVIARLAREGMTMMLVTHEIQFARRVADRIIFMEDGVIVEQGSPRQVIDNPVEARTAEFLRQARHDDYAGH